MAHHIQSGINKREMKSVWGRKGFGVCVTLMNGMGREGQGRERKQCIDVGIWEVGTVCMHYLAAVANGHLIEYVL